MKKVYVFVILATAVILTACSVTSATRAEQRRNHHDRYDQITPFFRVSTNRADLAIPVFGDSERQMMPPEIATLLLQNPGSSYSQGPGHISYTGPGGSCVVALPTVEVIVINKLAYTLEISIHPLNDLTRTLQSLVIDPNSFGYFRIRQGGYTVAITWKNGNQAIFNKSEPYMFSPAPTKSSYQGFTVDHIWTFQSGQ